MSAHDTVRRLTLTALATFGVLATGLVLAVTPGAALVGYSNTPSSVFGEPGSGNGQFSTPLGVAVDDSSGDVYVVDTDNDRVERFNGEGAYISQFDGSETPAGSFKPQWIAVDNSTDAAKGDVYVTDAGHNVIDVFDSSGKYVSQIVGTPSSFAHELIGVAVDGSGNVWAYEAYGTVDEFSDTGTFLSQFNQTHDSEGKGFAVDSSGNVYLLLGLVHKYTSNGTLLAEWGPFFGDALAVNESTSNVFLATPEGIDEFGPGGEPYGMPVEVFGSGRISDSRAMAVNDTTGTLYAQEAGTVAVFKSTLLPDVSIGAPGKVGRVSATLEGVVNPDGEEVTSCHFEYGTSTSYRQTVPCSPAPGSGSSPVPVSAEFNGLTLETTYHYRLAAGNANGTHVGFDSTFTTRDAVEGLLTTPATGVQSTSTALNGSLEPNGFDTHYWFEYGPSLSYGSSTPHEDAGEASEAKPVSATVTGMEPNSTYHYRLVGENGFGVTYGSDETLTTKAIVPAFTQQLPVSNITRTAATVMAKLIPENLPTTYRVVYGSTSSYGRHTAEFTAGAGIAEEAVFAVFEGLVPATTYHYAFVATNGAGTITGPEETFTTAPPAPPTATTGGASNITLTSATVSGTINPEGLATSYELDLGADTSYGTSIYGEVESGTEDVNIEVGLEDLAPGTTYHYRIVAINSDGRTYGADQTFTTPGYSNPIVLPAALPLLQTPAIAFPTETNTTTVKPKALTGAQRLAKALATCRRKKSKRRLACEAKARRRYGAAKKTKKG